MLSCQKAAALVHKKYLTGLTRTERMQLRMHTSMCSACRAFEKQNAFIEKALESRLNSEQEQPNLDSMKANVKADIDAQ